MLRPPLFGSSVKLKLLCFLPSSSATRASIQMTVFLPLAVDTPLPSTPPFLLESTDLRTQISKVIKSIMKAKRMVVMCGTCSSSRERKTLNRLALLGAGISVQAGIPDFRSSEGLFKTLKRDNPREMLASGKDLFDASVFNVSDLFCPWLHPRGMLAPQTACIMGVSLRLPVPC